MVFNIGIKLITFLAGIFHGFGLFLPNYYRMRASPKKPQSVPAVLISPASAVSPESDTNPPQIPTRNLEKLRMAFLIPFWLGSLLLLLNVLGTFSIFPSFCFIFASESLPNFFSYIALLVVFVSMLMANASGRALREHFLFPDQPVRPDWQLCTTGIYGKIRHPFYSFLNLNVIAFPLVVGFWPLLLLAPGILYFQYRIARAEENLMLQRFGDVFREYQQRTRMFF